MTVDESRPIRVVIVDDHQVVRQGLRTFLDLQDDIAVVGEAVDGADGVEQVGRLGPDVVLMDIVMPRMDGIEATRRIKEARPEVGVIALTSFAGDDQVLPGARGGRLELPAQGRDARGSRGGRPRRAPRRAATASRRAAQGDGGGDGGAARRGGPPPRRRPTT